ncbi:hypothetical protein [Sinorhizobium psoraleae]|uniref:Uncharacterized protein n=1 Tax=Sinorhizobium psoraleae TaxID=520838 RepID=A0ABT4KA56_9HYPH|nr:hypothetical protein [Sinorhizobium psoraleae]MCZ4088838.1 hypothetical protein [Sinorhizobium psoraleae]
MPQAAVPSNAGSPIPGALAKQFTHIGVAGPWRLLERVGGIFETFPVIIAVAVPGLWRASERSRRDWSRAFVICSPTSTGWRRVERRQKPLFTQRSSQSCAPASAVVNIDNGYGAACAAFQAPLT